MKIHEFKDCCWAICVTIGMVMLFMYGLIWMNNQYSIDDRVKDIYQTINLIKNQEEIYHKESNNLIYRNIMPSCIIKDPQWSRIPKKR